jgi:hypothetical protein
MLAKALMRKEAEEHLHELLKIFHVSSVNRAVLENALTGSFKDYEDGVIYHSALHANLEAILTRNQKDFKESKLPVYSPKDFLKAIDSLD